MGEHTDLPWKVYSKNGVLAIFSPTGSEVIHWSGFDAASFDDTTNRANAAFIVKAVNSHEALVKALEEIKACAICGYNLNGKETHGELAALLSKFNSELQKRVRIAEVVLAPVGQPGKP